MSEKPTKMPVLTKEMIEKIFQDRLNMCIRSADAQYALIGGALFTVLGIPGYETRDIDVAADKSISGYGILSVPRDRYSSPGTSNQYWVRGYKLDWMIEGTPGSKELYQAAIKTAYLSAKGIWLANLEYAMAIKVFANRPQDIEVYREFLDEGRINEKLVKDILKTYTNRIIK